MVDFGFTIIIILFVAYYLAVLIKEHKMLDDPKDILEKFLSVTLFYAGISLIFFSITGKPFLGDSPQTYNVYIFIIGFIAVLWTIPNLLSEFAFFKTFLNKSKKKKK
tara:strand:- start:1949 stop:2269 length:321 start_codon:yes stop_codon:yes gene_type:complete